MLWHTSCEFEYQPERVCVFVSVPVHIHEVESAYDESLVPVRRCFFVGFAVSVCHLQDGQTDCVST